MSEWKWFESYLTDRKLCVIHDKYKSVLKRVNFGVPRGGKVSPELLLVFFNEMEKRSNINTYVLYADSTSIFH